MSRLPWITMVVAAIAAFNPVGLEFIRNAFWSGEQLSRNIAQPIVFSAIAIFIIVAILESLVKYWLAR